MIAAKNAGFTLTFVLGSTIYKEVNKMEKEIVKIPISAQKNSKKMKSHKIKLRNTKQSDYESIKEIMNLVYSNVGDTL